jgi:hypothetical protein
MATKGNSQKSRVGNPNLTKTGKTRLGPLNLKQLEALAEKSSKPKEKAKINRRIQTVSGTRMPVNAELAIEVQSAVEVTPSENS